MYRGGTDELSNLQTLCSHCNLNKSDVYQESNSTEEKNQERDMIINILRINFKRINKDGNYNDPSCVNIWVDKSPLFRTSDDIKYDGKIAIVGNEFKKLVKNINTNKDHQFLFNSLFVGFNVDTDNITFKSRNIKSFNLSSGKFYALIHRDLVTSCLLGV